MAIERSAFGEVDEVDDAVLLVVNGSGVEEDAVAVLVIVPVAPADACATMRVGPGSGVGQRADRAAHRLAGGGATAGAAGERETGGQRVGDDHPAACDGPLLLTVSVYVTGEPGTMMLGLADFDNATSADVVTPRTADAELLPRMGSMVVELTTAVLVSEPAACALATNARMVTVTEPPLVTVPIGQLTALAATVQLP